MKIVKMHKGSREAFDDFLKQKLNEVEVDNDAADKYFAEMNLPVPVIPAAGVSFFAQHRNKLWLLPLLFCTTMATFTVLYNKVTNDGSTTLEKKSVTENTNNTAEKTSNVPIENSQIKEGEENLKNTDNRRDASFAINDIAVNGKAKNEKPTSKNDNKIFSETKKNNHEDASALLDPVKTMEQKTAKQTVGENIDSLPKAATKNTIKEIIKTDKKQPDSLYIIW